MRIEDFKPGMWIRCKLEPHLGRAFVLYVKDDSVSYHLEQPYCPHPRLGMGWLTGGTLYPAAFEYWEPVQSVPTAAASHEGKNNVGNDS